MNIADAATPSKYANKYQKIIGRLIADTNIKVSDTENLNLDYNIGLLFVKALNRFGGNATLSYNAIGVSERQFYRLIAQYSVYYDKFLKKYIVLSPQMREANTSVTRYVRSFRVSKKLVKANTKKSTDGVYRVMSKQRMEKCI